MADIEFDRSAGAISIRPLTDQGREWFAAAFSRQASAGVAFVEDRHFAFVQSEARRCGVSTDIREVY